MPAWLSELKEWIGPGAIAVATYFVIRFIQKRDKFEEEIEKKFKSHSDKFKEQLDAHSEKISASAKEFHGAVIEVKKEAADIKKSNLDFQSKIQTELLSISKQTSQIENTLERTISKAQEVDKKLDRNLVQITHLNEKISFHENVVSALVKDAQQTRSRLDRQEENYESIKKTIGDNLVILKKKKD